MTNIQRSLITSFEKNVRYLVSASIYDATCEQKFTYTRLCRAWNMQEQNVRRKLSFYRSFPLKLLPILLDVSLPSIHRQSLLRVTSHVRSYRRHDERRAWANTHTYVHAHVHTHAHVSVYVASRRRDRLTCCNLEAVYCYKPYIHCMCTAKRRFRKRHTLILLCNCSKLHRILAIANAKLCVTFEKRHTTSCMYTYRYTFLK